MEQLALWQATACGMNLANGLVVLTLRPAGKEMYDPVRHDELRSVEGVCSAVVSTGTAHLVSQQAPYIGEPAPTLENQSPRHLVALSPGSEGHPVVVLGAVCSPQYRSEMGIAWMTGFLDFPASRIEDGARFWRAVTGSTMSESRGSSAEFTTLLPKTGDPYLSLQRIERGAGGVHLDLHAENVDETSERALALGAFLLEARPHIKTFHSPPGVTFCVVPHRGERHRPPPTTWDGGSRSLVDQICVDTGPTTYLEEAAFWTGLTGWERRAGALSEFEFLVRPAHMPFRLLLQRLTETRQAAATFTWTWRAAMWGARQVGMWHWERPCFGSCGIGQP